MDYLAAFGSQVVMYYQLIPEIVRFLIVATVINFLVGIAAWRHHKVIAGFVFLAMVLIIVAMVKYSYYL
jgi:hypothetical protein